MMTSLRPVAPRVPALVAFVTLVVGGLTACGADGDQTLDLSPAGEAGREVALAKGCAACHGVNGQGGVGPPFAGLFGSTVAFDDGSTAVADEAYIIESITDPNAKIVAEYSLPMPETNLTDAEIASVIDYIRELSQPSNSTTP